MDINMPGMTGIERVSRLKAVHANLEVIMLTVSVPAARPLPNISNNHPGNACQPFRADAF